MNVRKPSPLQVFVVKCYKSVDKPFVRHPSSSFESLFTLSTTKPFYPFSEKYRNVGNKKDDESRRERRVKRSRRPEDPKTENKGIQWKTPSRVKPTLTDKGLNIVEPLCHPEITVDLSLGLKLVGSKSFPSNVDLKSLPALTLNLRQPPRSRNEERHTTKIAENGIWSKTMCQPLH